jgi:hypothetical protein
VLCPPPQPCAAVRRWGTLAPLLSPSPASTRRLLLQAQERFVNRGAAGCRTLTGLEQLELSRGNASVVCDAAMNCRPAWCKAAIDREGRDCPLRQSRRLLLQAWVSCLRRYYHGCHSSPDALETRRQETNMYDEQCDQQRHGRDCLKQPELLLRKRKRIRLSATLLMAGHPHQLMHGTQTRRLNQHGRHRRARSGLAAETGHSLRGAASL